MKIGFLGTGHITSSVIEGISKSNLKIKKIYISPRNKTIAKNLSKRFKKITISKNNQQVIDNSSWVFLAITPKVGNQILKKLHFNKNKKVISFISTMKMSELKKIIGNNIDIVRAIPLPPISLGVGPVPIFPKNRVVKKFFDKIGKTIEINNEQLSLNFWTMSSMMAPYYELLNNLSSWLVKKGINKKYAENYITSLFLGLSKNAYHNSYKDLNELVKKSQTPRGLNEQALKELKKSNFYKKLYFSANKIFRRLKGK